jgi:hypothetical protein
MVTPELSCERWKGLLAMEAIGQIDQTDRAELSAHVMSCEQCQVDRIELSRVVGALSLAEGSALEEAAVPTAAPIEEVRPSNLDAAVLAMFSGPALDSAPTGHRRRHHRVWAMVGVAATVIVVIGILTIIHHTATGSRTVALGGQGGNHGTALLIPEAWGTSIELTDHGGNTSQVLTVSMRTEYGHWWLAGSYRSVAAGDLRVTLACALPIQQIGSISVTDSMGNVVLHS